MGVNVGSAVAYLTLDRSGFKNSLHSAGTDLRNFVHGTGEAGGRLKSLGSAMTTTGATMTKKVTVPLVGAGVVMAKVAGDFEESANKVSTIADTKVKSMEELNAGILKISNDTGENASGLNEALYQTISATNDTGNALGYVSIASKAAKGGFTDTETAINGLTSVMNAYGIKGKKGMQKVSDLMLQTQNLGKTTFGELAQSLYNVIPTASSLGVGFDQISAAMSTITSQGTPTSVATTQLRQLFVELSKASSKTSKTFQKLSGKNFADFIKGGGTVQQALQIMEKGAKKNGVALKDLFSSVEAGNAAMQLTGNGAKKFANDLKGMQNSSGATEKAYKKMSKGMNDSIKKLLTSLKNLAITLGTVLAPIIAKIALNIKKLVDRFNKLPQPVKNIIVKFGLFIATIAPVLLILGKLITSVGTVVSTFRKLKTAVMIFKMLPGLITPHTLIIVAAIAAIGLIVYEVIKHWGTLRKAGGKLYKSLSNTFKKISSFFKSSINGWKAIFRTAGDFITDGLIGGIKRKIGKIKRVIGKIGSTIKNVFKKVMGINSPSRVFAKYGGFIGEGLVQGIDGQEGAINNKFGGLANKIKGLGNVRPNFSGLNDLALSGAYGGSNGGSKGFSNISNSNTNSKQLNFNPNITMHVTIADTKAKGTEQLTSELKGMTKTAMKNTMMDMFMNDATRSF